MTTLRAGGATDVGCVRQINEDRYLIGEGLYAVADGVGGHQAGEIASQTSVEVLKRSFTEHTTSGLLIAVEKANRAVWQLAQEADEQRGMGTTITAVALVVDDGEEQLAVANVGDSRAYLFQEGELIQLTRDHSLVEEMVREGQITPQEAAVHPQRSIITRALGMEPHVDVDTWQITPYQGDRLLLCSDGLTNELTDERIAAVLRQLADATDAAKELVRLARTEGGSDNITAVVIDVVDDDDRATRQSQAIGTETGKRMGPVPARPPREAEADERWADQPLGAAPSTATKPPSPPARPSPPPRRGFTWRLVAFVLLLLAVLAVGGASVRWYARSVYFVGLDGDRLAVYRGRPGGLLGFEPVLVDRKPVTLDEVPPKYHRVLAQGHLEPTKARADIYVNRLREEGEVLAQATSTTTSTPPTDPAEPTPEAPPGAPPAPAPGASPPPARLGPPGAAVA